MNDNLSDLYIDYLIGSFGAATATGLSSSVGGSISHDKITRMLPLKPGTSADPRRTVGPPIRQSETADGVPITDGQYFGKASDRRKRNHLSAL